MSTQKNWIDYLRFCAVLAVISIHVTAPIYERFGDVPSTTWWMANILNAFSRFSVPAFIMITGALFLGQQQDTLVFYKKRATKIIVPLLFWSVIYISYRVINGESFLHATISSIAHGKAYGHLWFLTLYLWLVLYIPFINKAILGLPFKPRDWKILCSLIILNISAFWISSLSKSLLEEKMSVLMNFPFFFIYLLLGFFASRNIKKIKLSSLKLLIIAVILTTLACLLNFLVCAYSKTCSDYIVLNNLSPLTILITASLFCAFCKLTESFTRFRIPAQIAQCTFGIYLIHPLILQGLINESDFFNSLAGPVAIPIQIFATFSLSLVTIYIVRTTALGRKLC